MLNSIIKEVITIKVYKLDVLKYDVFFLEKLEHKFNLIENIIYFSSRKKALEYINRLVQRRLKNNEQELPLVDSIDLEYPIIFNTTYVTDDNYFNEYKLHSLTNYVISVIDVR